MATSLVDLDVMLGIVKNRIQDSGFRIQHFGFWIGDLRLRIGDFWFHNERPSPWMAQTLRVCGSQPVARRPEKVCASRRCHAEPVKRSVSRRKASPHFLP